MQRIIAVFTAIALCAFIFGCTAEILPDASDKVQTLTVTEPIVDKQYVFEQSTSGQNPKKVNYYFVFVSKVIHPYYDQIKKGVESAIADYEARGIHIDWDWDSPAQVDPIEQVTSLEAAAALNPDAIGVVVSDPSVVDPVIKEIVDQGIPVITLSEDSDTKDRTAFVGRSNFYSEGETVAKAVAEKLGYKGKVGLLIGSQNSIAHYQRTEAIRRVLEQYPDIEIVAEEADDDSREAALDLAEQMLVAHQNLDAIISSDGSAHASAAQAVTDAGKSGIILLAGFDAIPETIVGIESGSIYTSLAANCYQMGRWIVQVMIDAADHEVAGDVDDILVDTYLLTRDNLPTYMDVVG